MRSFWIKTKTNWVRILLTFAACFVIILIGELHFFSLASTGSLFSFAGAATAFGVIAGGATNALIWVFILTIFAVAAGFTYNFSKKGESVKATLVMVVAAALTLVLGVWWALNGFNVGPILHPIVLSALLTAAVWIIFIAKPRQESFWRHSPASAVPPPTPANPSRATSSATSQASPPPDSNPDNPDDPKMR